MLLGTGKAWAPPLRTPHPHVPPYSAPCETPLRRALVQVCLSVRSHRPGLLTKCPDWSLQGLERWVIFTYFSLLLPV